MLCHHPASNFNAFIILMDLPTHPKRWDNINTANTLRPTHFRRYRQSRNLLIHIRQIKEKKYSNIIILLRLK